MRRGVGLLQVRVSACASLVAAFVVGQRGTVKRKGKEMERYVKVIQSLRLARVTMMLLAHGLLQRQRRPCRCHCGRRRCRRRQRKIASPHTKKYHTNEMKECVCVQRRPRIILAYPFLVHSRQCTYAGRGGWSPVIDTGFRIGGPLQLFKFKLISTTSRGSTCTVRQTYQQPNQQVTRTVLYR